MLLLHLAGCKTMQPLETPYTVTLYESAADDVQVTMRAGDRLTIRDPRIEGDVLSGQLLDERNRRTDILWRAPLSEVEQVAVPRTSVARTVLAVAFAVPLVAFTLALLSCAGGACDTTILRYPPNSPSGVDNGQWFRRFGQVENTVTAPRKHAFAAGV
jgi:hypothetical protein